MCFYIGIEDLVANALIEVMKKNDKRFLSYNEIEEYGAEVIRCLKDTGEKAVLILSKSSTEAFFRNYSEFFIEKNNNGTLGIALNEGKKIEDLIQQFRGYLAIDVLLAFINKKSISKLGIY